MDPVTMMVASVGIQFFNNYATNKKTKELQARQREFQTAVTNGEFERMRKAQADAAKLALELEEDVHKQRLQEIVDNYDNVLKDFAHSFTIENWPLNVLPFIMKGESFGSLIKGTSQSINMHCILTPSNCNWFNEYFYDDLDLRIEAEMNNHWNAQSTHPIVYYGGGWNRRLTKTNGYSMPKPIDLDDIALLRNQLRQIPTMVITPYFTPYLHFRVCLWGMGKDNDTPFVIDPMQGNVAPKDRIFSYDYIKDKTPELTDDFFNTTMEEIVPYLTSLIGFVSDKYFWSLYRIPPILPLNLYNNPSLHRYYQKEYILLATENYNESILTLSDAKHQIEYIDSVEPIITAEEKKRLENDIITKINREYLTLINAPMLTSYNDAKTFIRNQQEEQRDLWVNVCDFDERFYDVISEERLDLIKLLDEFVIYVDSCRAISDKAAIAIYIEEFEFKEFLLHLYNIETKKVMQIQQGYAYKVSTNLPYHINNIRVIFKHEKHKAIICKYDRIEKLKVKIIENVLTF